MIIDPKQEQYHVGGNLVRLKPRPIVGCKCSLCHPENWGMADPEAAVSLPDKARQAINIQLNGPTTELVADLMKKAARAAIKRALHAQRGLPPPEPPPKWMTGDWGWDPWASQKEQVEVEIKAPDPQKFKASVDYDGNPWDQGYGWDVGPQLGTVEVEAATKALSPEDRRRYLQDNFLAVGGPMTSRLKGNDLKFEVRWSPSAFCWTLCGPKNFYMAIHDESLAEAVKALLEGKTDVARSFADTFLLDKGMLP